MFPAFLPSDLSDPSLTFWRVMRQPGSPMDSSLVLPDHHFKPHNFRLQQGPTTILTEICAASKTHRKIGQFYRNKLPNNSSISTRFQHHVIWIFLHQKTTTTIFTKPFSKRERKANIKARDVPKNAKTNKRIIFFQCESKSL